MNHDEGLDFDEVAKLIRSIGANPTQADIQTVFDEIDANGIKIHDLIMIKFQ